MKKIKSIATIAVFAAILIGFSAAHFILADSELSYAERRRLKQAPEFSAEDILSGEYMEDLDEYMVDQFPLRNELRSVKAAVKYNVLKQKDNNDIFIVHDHASKIDKVLNENQLLYGMDKIAAVRETYLENCNVYMSLIPDKNYFLAEENGYPHYDYGRMQALVTENLPDEITYIDIFGDLDISDYYRTDTHWKQECIYPVVQTLADAMGVGNMLTPESEYKKVTMEPFYGVYYGQAALPIGADTLCYLTSSATENAVVTGNEFEGERGVYDEGQFESMDGYNVFLHGPQALLTIENPDAATDRELIIFRDSFGSSLAPLFTGTYSKITLIDLRYIGSSFLPQFVEFTDQDVLFIYSTTLMNSAMLLK